MREALIGNTAEAKVQAAAALRRSTGRDVLACAAWALAMAGDTHKAEALAGDLTKRFPEDTIVQFEYLPVLSGQLALGRAQPMKTIETLQAAAPYELGLVAGLFPVYVRGKAYLAAGRGGEAAAEFQKILDHPGVMGGATIGALAHLQLGRAYALQGDTAKARTKYQDFVTLWKDTDADIPVLKQAKTEYAKLE